MGRAYQNYTRTNPVPHLVACCCGTCGLTYHRTLQNGRRRVWAPDCPTRAALKVAESAERLAATTERRRIRHEQAIVNRANREAAAKALRDEAAARRKAARPFLDKRSGPIETSTKFCDVCYDMPHRRPTHKLCACRKRHESERIERPSVLYSSAGHAIVTTHERLNGMPTGRRRKAPATATE